MLALERSNRSAGWRSPLVSATLHLLAIAALAFVVPHQRRPTVRDVPVTVEIVPQQSVAKPAERTLPPAAGVMETSPPDVAGQRALPDTPARSAIPSSGPSQMVRPERMLSQGALSNPRSRAARRQLGSMAADERAVQLCGIEAMEQIHAWKAQFVPQAVVAYATQGLKIRGESLVADGAAFYSAPAWYRLRFECVVRSDEVVSFAYSVGEAIPQADWEAYSLPDRAADEDG